MPRVLTRGAARWGFQGDAKNLPLEFGPAKNLLWKCELPAGHSSPCVTGNRIFLTGYGNKTLETFGLDRATGAILWRRPVPAEKIERVHPISNPAAPTPATDGQRVFVYFGSYGLVCYDLDGTEFWKKPMAVPKNMYGTAASPIVAGGMLIFSDDKAENSCLWALDPKTGETIWKKNRAPFTAGWSTPLIWRNEGVEEVIIYGNWWLVAYDLKNGDERWTFGGAYYASLIAGDRKIFAASMQGVVTVFEAGDKLKVLARNDLGERIMATPAIVEGRIYVRTDKNLYAFGLK